MLFTKGHNLFMKGILAFLILLIGKEVPVQT